MPERLRPRFLRDALVVRIGIDGERAVAGRGASEAEIAAAAGICGLGRAAVDAVIAGETSMEESASF